MRYVVGLHDFEGLSKLEDSIIAVNVLKNILLSQRAKNSCQEEKSSVQQFVLGWTREFYKKICTQCTTSSLMLHTKTFEFQDESSLTFSHLHKCCGTIGGLIQKAVVIQVCVMKLAQNSEF